MISVTVPICNEAGTLPALCARIRETLQAVGRPWELILVNDGSTDGSDELLDEIAAADPQIKVIHFRRNFGQTAAMMAGFDFAKGEIIIPIDGDLQNDPADIPLMLAKLDEGFDVCSGWRKDRQGQSLKRNLPSIMANRLISFVSGVRLHDFGCSLKAYRREVIEGVRLYGEMHRFLPIYVSWHGARIAEVEVRHYARTSAAKQIRAGARAEGARRPGRGEVPRPLSAEADVSFRRGRPKVVVCQPGGAALSPSGGSSWNTRRSSRPAPAALRLTADDWVSCAC